MEHRCDEASDVAMRGASDVVVVGGGPVGLAAAMYAVRGSLSVVVLEPREGAVDKACGEGLMPGGLRALSDLGVSPVGWDLVGIRYVGRGRHAEAEFSAAVGRNSRRGENPPLGGMRGRAVVGRGARSNAGARPDPWT
jgi:2-polyprenyl-6-methoxyphenol hydroxylase-like FAD-dependent oxidoreductase